MNNLQYYDKYNTGNIGDFDRNHAGFRSQVFIQTMYRIEEKFIANFVFEGDENFTREKQRIMLKMLFRYGYSGIINTIKQVENNMEFSVAQLDVLTNKMASKIIKEQLSNYIPVGVFPYQWDLSENILSATALTAPRHNIGKRTYNVTAYDTAIVKYNESQQSGWFKWLPYVYMMATGDTILKKRLTTLDGKLVQNNVNNTLRNEKYADIYAVDQSFIDMTPSQRSISDDKEVDVIDVSTMIDQKLKKLDLSQGENINDLLTFVKEYQARIDKINGVRTNTNDGKQERSISDDFKSDEVHFALAEKESIEQMDIFIDNYKEVFGVQLTLKVTTEEKINEMQELELNKSGRDDTNAPSSKKEGKDD